MENITAINRFNLCTFQMGYAKSDQVGSGIHFRQYSRAFIIADSSNKRVVFISADIGMGTQIVKIEVGIINFK